MDVSRIEAISPKQIDWRRLTAKEIIKYEQQGMDVPIQYLQWAQEFINSIYSDDKTTYQMASSQTTTASSTSKILTSTEGSSNTEETTSDETEKTAAQQKREDMQNDGDGLLKQAIIFIGHSTDGNNETQISKTLISSIENASVNEIETLENYMADLLSKAEEKQNEFKNEIAKLNDDKTEKVSFAKINQLQQELQKYGTQGQTKVAVAEGVLSGYDAMLNEQTPVIDNAKDFGTETLNIGEDLLQKNRSFNIFEWIFGILATTIGGTTVKNAEETEDIKNQAIDKNSANLQNISGLKTEVENKTGVKTITSPDNQKAEKSNEKDTSTQKEKDNVEKVAQNDGTDTTDKATTNIDEILKRKIRKGENVDNPTA